MGSTREKAREEVQELEARVGRGALKKGALSPSKRSAENLAVAASSLVRKEPPTAHVGSEATGKQPSLDH